MYNPQSYTLITQISNPESFSRILRRIKQYNLAIIISAHVTPLKSIYLASITYQIPPPPAPPKKDRRPVKQNRSRRPSK